MANKNLSDAKKAKNDEFYTQLSDIEKELSHYKRHFKNKTVFLNCDDPEWSNFWVYFSRNFDHLGLKKLVSTHFSDAEKTYKLEIIRGKDLNGDGKFNEKDTVKTPLKSNGDFRSQECIDILKEADIVVTNPPFSLFRQYIAQLVEYNKKFLVVGNMNAITYREIFPLIKENKLWVGYNFNKTMEFRLPDSYERFSRVDEDSNKYGNVPAICWFTNLSHKKRNEELVLYRKYNKKDYPKYDNYDAINVDKVKDIPENYFKPMGVPITFLDKYSPEQFEILGSDYEVKTGVVKGIARKDWLGKIDRGYIDGKRIYARILIRRKEMKQ